MVRGGGGGGGKTKGILFSPFPGKPSGGGRRAYSLCGSFARSRETIPLPPSLVHLCRITPGEGEGVKVASQTYPLSPVPAQQRVQNPFPQSAATSCFFVPFSPSRKDVLVGSGIQASGHSMEERNDLEQEKGDDKKSFPLFDPLLLSDSFFLRSLTPLDTRSQNSFSSSLDSTGWGIYLTYETTSAFGSSFLDRTHTTNQALFLLSTFFVSLSLLPALFQFLRRERERGRGRTASVSNGGRERIVVLVLCSSVAEKGKGDKARLRPPLSLSMLLLLRRGLTPFGGRGLR